MSRVSWSFNENRPKKVIETVSFHSNRARLVVGIPESLFHSINRARGDFPRETMHPMSMAKAVTYVLQSCPVAVEQEALVW